MVRKPGEKRHTETHTHEKAMAVVEELRGKLRTGGRKFSREEMNER